MPSAVSAITVPRPSAMIDRLAGVETDSEICDWIEARENFSIDLSKRRVSCASLLKYLTVS